MPHNSPIVFIAAHGVASGQHTVVPYGRYNIVMPTTMGKFLDLTTHNFILKMLLNKTSDFKVSLELIESLPSTVSIAFEHRPQVSIDLLQLQNGIDLGDHNCRGALIYQILSAWTKATNSQKSWELFEHRLLPASDILGPCIDIFGPSMSVERPPLALTPKNFPCVHCNPNNPLAISDTNNPNSTIFCGFREYPLITSQSMATPMTSTNLCLYFNLNNAIATLMSVNRIDHTWPNGKTAPIQQGNISLNQLIYVNLTPPADPHISPSALSLSEVLRYLSSIHILVSMNGGTITMVDCVLQECLDVMSWTPTQDATQVYDISLPDDTNVILGACRTADYSF